MFPSQGSGYFLVFTLRHCSYTDKRKEWNGQKIGSEGDVSGFGIFHPILSCTVLWYGNIRLLRMVYLLIFLSALGLRLDGRGRFTSLLPLFSCTGIDFAGFQYGKGTNFSPPLSTSQCSSFAIKNWCDEADYKLAL